jgi:hypothetical protein
VLGVGLLAGILLIAGLVLRRPMPRVDASAVEATVDPRTTPK